MNIEKQIMDMEIALHEAQHEYDKAWTECFHNNGKQPRRENLFYAEYLVENKGYCKASDIAKEIYEKLVEKATLNYYCGYITVALEDVANVIREYVEDRE